MYGTAQGSQGVNRAGFDAHAYLGSRKDAVMPSKYSEEFKVRAIRPVMDPREDYGSEFERDPHGRRAAGGWGLGAAGCGLCNCGTRRGPRLSTVRTGALT